LFSRLWAELDNVLSGDDASRSAGFTSASGTQVLRLELIVLLDACQSTRWRAQLDSSQRLSLQSILDDILHDLNASNENEIPQGSIERAQDSLLDAIQDQCATLNGGTPQPTNPTCRWTSVVSTAMRSFDGSIEEFSQCPRS
jgi:hypothetical protein